MALYRGPDPWTNADSSHLSRERRKEALEMKNALIFKQSGRDMEMLDVAPWRTRFASKRTMEHLDAFCDSMLHRLEQGRQIVILETRGDDDRWVERRRRLDGEIDRNPESAGVTAITLRLA